jgi:hypothetical protein
VSHKKIAAVVSKADKKSKEAKTTDHAKATIVKGSGVGTPLYPKSSEKKSDKKSLSGNEDTPLHPKNSEKKIR